MTPEERKARAEARKAAREQAKRAAEIEAEKNQKPVKQIDIAIEWHKSRTWGSNPVATATVQHADGSYSRLTASCSGCGYDKESTVVAEIFNQTLKYRLYQLPPDTNPGKSIYPYGMSAGEWHYYHGGVGMSCYPKIAEAIGGTMEHIASGKTFDAWRFTMKEGGQ